MGQSLTAKGENSAPSAVRIRRFAIVTPPARNLGLGLPQSHSVPSASSAVPFRIPDTPGPALTTGPAGTIRTGVVVGSDRTTSKGVGTWNRGLADWRPKIQEWIDAGEFERVLDRFETWDNENAEWWSLFGPFLDEIPSEFIHRRPGMLLRTVVPTVWAGRETEAYEILKHAEDKIAELQDDGLKISAAVTRANLYVVSKRLDEALALLTATEGSVREAKHRLQVLNALGLLQATHSFELDKARASFAEHANLALDAGISIAHIVALINRAWHVEIVQGRFREARLLGRKLLEMRSSPDDSPFCKLCASMILGAIEWELGEEKAFESFRQSLELAERLQYKDVAFASCEFLALLYAEKGMLNEAAEWIDRCESKQNDEKRPSPELYWAKARLAALAGDVAGIEKQLAFAVDGAPGPDVRNRSGVVALLLHGGAVGRGVRKGPFGAEHGHAFWPAVRGYARASVDLRVRGRRDSRAARGVPSRECERRLRRALSPSRPGNWVEGAQPGDGPRR
jgi:hypothetical protein